MNIINFAKKIFDIELKELSKVKNNINTNFENACDLINNSKGKVIVTGVGKSGLIGQKIAATLSSTGTSAFFLNAAEALHGDLGVIEKNDIIIMISNSGQTDEILAMIPSIKKIGAKIIALTGNQKSDLANKSDIIINIGVDKEACPINLAPTSSSTSTLVMGDAMALVLSQLKDFKPENFALYHPGGSLGRRLLMKVDDMMLKDSQIPVVPKDASMQDVLFEITNKRIGGTCVSGDNNMLLGIITEGDIRRALEEDNGFYEKDAFSIMTKNPIKINDRNMLAIDAIEIMEENEILIMPVVTEGSIVGILRLHDLIGKFK